ncbi:cytochrome P450 [Mycobacterium sp. LTG2003]
MTASLSQTASDAPARFELATADTWASPWAMYAALRDRDPVHHVVPADQPGQDYYVLSRHADIWAAARDHETFSSAQGLTVTYGELEMIGLADNPPFVMQDPPGHTQFRKLVSRGFTPRQVEAVEPKVREFVVERLERLRADGGGDIVTELFKPLPSMVVAHYLGVPDEDRAQFDGWTEAIVAANTASGGITSAMGTAGEAVASMMGYFSELIERRRREPQDDTISHLVAAGVGADGDIAGVLSILAFTFTMVTGGNDTTTGMLGGAVQLLHQRPDQRQLLVDDPALITDAVDEFLRLTSPVQGLARTTTRDVMIGDTTIPAGRKTLLLYGSGNRDEREFGPDAAELDVRRKPRNILTFSHGAHFCLGAAAARMQSRVALTELLSRYPDFEVDVDAVVWAGGSYVRRPLSVPFRAGS